MADRKGKARAWSAAKAVPITRTRNVSIEATRALAARCYLAGVKAASVSPVPPWLLLIAEQARLGMSPQAKRKGKSGEGR